MYVLLTCCVNRLSDQIRIRIHSNESLELFYLFKLLFFFISFKQRHSPVFGYIRLLAPFMYKDNLNH